MTKKEILKLLDKEIGLFVETGDDEEITLELKKSEEILEELNGLRDSAKKWELKLKGIVDGDERFTVVKISDFLVKDKNITIDGDLILIGDRNIFSNNYMSINNPK